MNFDIDNFLYNQKDYYYKIILLLIGIVTIFVSNILYIYEINLSQQDARNYILLSENLKNYFYIQNQVAMRVVPSLLAGLIYKLQIFDIFNTYRILSYFFFLILIIRFFNLFIKLNIKPYLAFSFTLIIVFQNHSILYSIFNIYQLVDLLVYVFSIFIFENLILKNYKKLFFYSILIILTKEYMIVLITLIYLYLLLNEKENRIRNLIYFFMLIFIFFLNYYFAGIFHFSNHRLDKYVTDTFFDFDRYYENIFQSLFIKKNILIFLPFLLFFLDKKFLLIVNYYWPLFIFSFLPISFSILLFDEVGNNFFRVYYQGFFIWSILGLLFLSKKFNDNTFFEKILFFLPLVFIYDFLIIALNISQDGFFNFFQVTRYLNFSSFYIFNIIVIFLLLKNEKK